MVIIYLFVDMSCGMNIVDDIRKRGCGVYKSELSDVNKSQWTHLNTISEELSKRT